MKRCVLNYASGIYIKGQERLKTSLRASGFTGDLLFWTDELPPDCPPHDDSPWAFKVYAFAEARRRGYDSALWIDSNGVVIRPLDPLFAKIEHDGYFLWGRGAATVGEWSSDRVLESFDLTREQAFKIPEIAAFSVGLNFHDRTANDFLDRWLDRAGDGFSFRGIPKEYPLAFTNNNEGGVVSADTRVKGHRHDQTIGSILASQLKMRHSRYFCFDYVGEAGPGRSYAKHIPLNICLLQNRDIKSDHYLPAVDKWGNKKGFWTRGLFWGGALGLTVLRWLKDAVKKV